MQIELVLATILKNPFSKRITDVKVLPTDKLRIMYYSGDSDTTDHVMEFNIALGRAHFIDEETDADFCQLFVESIS